MMATAAPMTQVPYVPSATQPAAQYEPPMMPAAMPTKVNPILTKVPSGMRTPPSDVILVQNNSGGQARPAGAGASAGAGGLTQGLITKKA
jgi:hypothetical protein